MNRTNSQPSAGPSAAGSVRPLRTYADSANNGFRCLKAGNVSGPAVSVVIPIYNVEQYVRECLDSVTGQTLKDIEIICVNDGSTDRSLEITLELAAKDRRVSVYTQQNSGLGASRNKGLSVAKGEYVYFLDSDDVLSVDALKKLYTKSKYESLDVLCFAADSFYQDDSCSRHHPWTDYPITGEYHLCSGSSLFNSLRQHRVQFTPVWLRIYRTGFLWDNGIRMPEGILHEDHLFSLQAFLKAQRANTFPEMLIHHRIHQDSIMTSSYDINHLYGYFRSYTEGLQLLLSMDLNNEIRQAAYGYLLDIAANARKVYNTSLNQAEQEYFWQTFSKDQTFPFHIGMLLSQQETLRIDIDRLQQQSDYLQGKINLMENSKAYRLGKALTAIPRALKNAFKKNQA